MKFSILALIACTALFTSCSSASETTQEAIAEKIAGKLLGADIDVENYSTENLAANSAKINLKVDGERLFRKDDGYKGAVMLFEDNISIQISEEEEGQVIIGVSGKNLYARQPITAQLKKGQKTDDQLTGTIIISKMIDENTKVSYMLQEGEINITRLSKETVGVELSGTVFTVGSAMSDTGGQNLKEISGSVVINYPVVTGMGKKLSEVTY